MSALNAELARVVPPMASEEAADNGERRRFAELGVYTPSMLDQIVEGRDSQQYLVHGLLRDRSINLLVGDSTLGKTPLAVQLGECVASGTPFLGLAVRQGPVLYCDGETDLHAFNAMLHDISRAIGLPDPPAAFHTWSPNWERGSAREDRFSTFLGGGIDDRIALVKPVLVIIDPLRVFWPHAEGKSEEALAVIASLRRLQRQWGCSFLISHHRRKADRQAPSPNLSENPHQWFQESAGAYALVNQTDTRLGVVPQNGQADLLLGGLMRGYGPVAPLDLHRISNDAGDPIGYGLLTGVELLNAVDRDVFNRLPTCFRFKDAETLFGDSGSNARRFIQKCLVIGVVTKDKKEYVKHTNPAVERVE